MVRRYTALLRLCTSPQVLRRYAQGPVELARRVLPGYGSSELHQGVLFKDEAQAREEIVVHVLVGNGHALGVLQGHALLLLVQRARGVLVHGEYLLVGNPQVAAHGSVYVLSEFAAVYGSDSPVNEGDEPGVDEAREV